MEIKAREEQMIKDVLATATGLKPHIQPFINYSPLNFFTNRQIKCTPTLTKSGIRQLRHVMFKLAELAGMPQLGPNPLDG